MDTDRPLHEEWKKRVRSVQAGLLGRDNRGSPTNISQFRVLNLRDANRMSPDAFFPRSKDISWAC